MSALLKSISTYLLEKLLQLIALFIKSEEDKLQQSDKKDSKTEENK